MTTDVRVLAAAAVDLQRHSSLSSVLQLFVERAAELLEVRRVSVRLVDKAGQLPTRVRAGEAVHDSANFTVGEGLVGWIAEHGQPLRIGRAEDDPRFVERPGRREPIGAFLGVPLLHGRTCIGVVAAVHPARDYFTVEHEEILTVLAAVAAPHVELARLERLTQLDPLTGALNRNGLEATFPELAALPPPLSIAILDIDHFKQVNDQHGHALGDEVLRAVARLLMSQLRATDAVVRYGGEEFLIILPGVGLRHAERALERSRASIAEASLAKNAAKNSDRPVRVTVSAGVAQRRENETRNDVIARADAALYLAKRAGRNRVAIAPG
jgi:diguanylate cyclase (GGDEF)-like protein